ncbi:hypothetical protein [Clostridium sp. FP1]|uniref:hypothetical protein n=1 Tax=Clostridium sp. FP1 TaxID=2724076 RepID=UPI0013E90974|nr:hypothetical protein [Clostridium sp. FP1]MBZ9635486.1 hypothetical protein [Clostridium sp. FP1]
MEIKEYDSKGMRIREITQDGVLIGREEFPIPVETPVVPQLSLEDKINYLYYKDKGMI